MNIEFNLNGKKISGYWNGKIYNSRENGFKVVYIDKKEYNINEEDLITIFGKNAYSQNKIRNVQQLFNELDDYEKILFFSNNIITIEKTIKKYGKSNSKLIKKETNILQLTKKLEQLQFHIKNVYNTIERVVTKLLIKHMIN